MNHDDHVELLSAGVQAPGGLWADFGAGSGAFTLALAELLGPAAEIIAVDRDGSRLRTAERSLRDRFPATSVRSLVADFGEPLELPALDGIVIANALHFAPEQGRVLGLLRGYLAPDAPLLVIEYNTPRSSAAVPHPVPFARLRDLCREAGFTHTELLRTRPSRFFQEIYSAVSR